MPDPNGTAVVMKCADMSELQEYLCCLSLQLNSDFFEIVPVEFHVHNIVCNEIDIESSKKSNSSEFNSQSINNRVQKAQEYEESKNIPETNETTCRRQPRLSKNKECMKRKRSQESDLERQIRLEKNNGCQKRKRAQESDLQREIRLEKDKASHKRKR